jgi:hypothetical protein
MDEQLPNPSVFVVSKLLVTRHLIGVSNFGGNGRILDIMFTMDIRVPHMSSYVVRKI